MDSLRKSMAGLILLLSVFCGSAQAWTGEIRGRVVCDVCADSSVGPEDHALEGSPASLLDLTLVSFCIVILTDLSYVQLVTSFNKPSIHFPLYKSTVFWYGAFELMLSQINCLGNFI
jgi:hypothetical protein